MNRTDNYIMWDCLYDIFVGRATRFTDSKVFAFLHDYRINQGKEINNNFSIDNWQVVCCWIHIFAPDLKKYVPLFGHHTKHPLKFVEMLWMKYWIFAPFKVITLIDMAVRHLIIRRKTDQGGYHTSGLLLDYYVMYSYEEKLLMRALTRMMKTMFTSWYFVMKAYHGNENHYNHKVFLAWKERLK